MNNDEAKAILKTMSALFFNVPFNKDDPDSIKIYMKQLSELDYKLCDKALDDLVKTNKFCPSISDIRERYFAIKKTSTTLLEMNNKNICKTCNNNGFIVFTKYVNEYCIDEVKLPLSYIAYCDKCDKGKQWEYDGTKCEKYPTKYHVLPISRYKLEGNHANNV